MPRRCRASNRSGGDSGLGKCHVTHESSDDNEAAIVISHEEHQANEYRSEC